jgi:hypothetical protein
VDVLVVVDVAVVSLDFEVLSELGESTAPL